MPVVRTLNQKGIEHFRQFLQLIRRGEAVKSPAFTFDDTCALPVNGNLHVEPKAFGSKYEMAFYLHEALGRIDRPDILEDAGLWSWLALFYIDELSPEDSEGRRRPREDYHYVLVTSSDDHSPGWARTRHLLAGPYSLFRRHGRSARVLLSGKPHEHGKFVYDLAWRSDLISNRGLVEAVERLYFDSKAGRPKRGATTDSNPGNLRRFIAVLQQLDFNYDLQGMTAKQILELLPSEFDRWQ